MNGSGPLRHGAEEGSVAVEAGIIVSVLLMLLVGSVEFGRALWISNTMLLAVEDAARYAMVYNHGSLETCAAQSQASLCPTLSNTPLANCSAERVQYVLSAYQAPSIDVSVNEDTTSSPATITVCASYSFDFVVPQFLPYGPLSLTRQITVPLI